MRNYGITSVGKHTVVCVVLNASSIDVKYLEDKFPDLLITRYKPSSSNVEKVRIEGCVLNRSNFHVNYHHAKARATKHENWARYERTLRDVKFNEMLVRTNRVRGIIHGVKVLLKLEDNK